MTVLEQIKELNEEVRCYIKPSKIAGVGVFALRDIKKGEKLHLIPNQVRRWFSVPYERLDELKPEIKEIVLARWPSVILGSLFVHPNDEIWMASFINHAEPPNDSYDVDSDSAKCDIPAGTEITENYHSMRRHREVYPWLNCSC